MRRQNAISVKVRMPSRGLVTRLPSESADLFRAGDTQRCFAAAQQVRFEDGVVCAGTGYEKAVVTGTPAIDLVTTGTYVQPAVGSTVVITTVADPVGAGVTVGMILEIPDAPTTDTYLVTAVSTGPNTVTGKLLTVGGTNIPTTVIASDTHLKTANTPNGPILKLHQANLLSPAWLLDANTLADNSTPLVAATGNSLYSVNRSFDSVNQQYDAEFTRLFTGITADEGVPWYMADNNERVIFAQRSNIPQTWISGDTQANPLPGLPITDNLWDGVEVFFNHVLLWRGDRLKWGDVDDFTNYIPVANTASTFVLTVSAATFTQPALGSTVTIPVNENPVALVVTPGQYIRINADPFYSFYLVTAVTTSTVTATLQSLTGAAPPGTVIASGTQVFSVDANEAGETQVTGSDSNGAIRSIIRLGDYAFVFKDRSVSSIQYVGVGSGIFFIHTELTGEGLIAPQAVINLGNGNLVFFGHRELYMYTGGPTPTPICQQVTRQIYAELDRGRLGEILLYHNENRKEVWLHYPIAGGTKVLVWNYIEDTATFDLVNPLLKGYTALTAADWSSDLRWIDIPDSQIWSTYDPTIAWDDLSTGTVDHLTLMANGDSNLRIQGFDYTQDGQPYVALAESMDFDFGDNDMFKYVDLVAISAQVNNPTTADQLLYIQIGTKDSLDQPLRWTAPLTVNLKGGDTPPIRVNPGGSGRYVRLRVYSQDANVQWRISTFEISCRQGNTY